MAHGHGHKKGCRCGFCRLSAQYAGKGGKRKRRGRRKGR